MCRRGVVVPCTLSRPFSLLLSRWSKSLGKVALFGVLVPFLAYKAIVSEFVSATPGVVPACRSPLFSPDLRLSHAPRLPLPHARPSSEQDGRQVRPRPPQVLVARLCAGPCNNDRALHSQWRCIPICAHLRVVSRKHAYGAVRAHGLRSQDWSLRAIDVRSWRRGRNLQHARQRSAES